MVSMIRRIRALGRTAAVAGVAMWVAQAPVNAQEAMTKGEAKAAAGIQIEQKGAQPAQPGAPVLQPVGPQLPVKPAQPVGPQPTVVLQPGEAPVVEFDTPVYDFGKIRAGIDVHHDFWFTNTGTGPLEILAVRPSCGCTQAGSYDHVVMPGQSGKIPLKVAPGNMTGPVSKNITIMTNAAAPGNTVTLTMKGELWQIVQVAPQSAYFGKILVDEAATINKTMDVTITTNNGAVANIGEVKSSSPAFKGEVTEVTPGSKYTLTISLVPPLKEGNNYGIIEVQTGIAEMPKVTVTATAMVSPELEISPNQIAVMSTSKVAMKRPIIVRNNNVSTKMTLTNLACTNPAVTVESKEVTPGQVFQIMVDLPANYTKVGPENDMITFNTDKPGHELVKVPIIEQQAAMPYNPQAAMIQTPGPVKAVNPAAAPGVPGAARPELGIGGTNPNAPAQPAANDPHAGHGH